MQINAETQCKLIHIFLNQKVKKKNRIFQQLFYSSDFKNLELGAQV